MRQGSKHAQAHWWEKITGIGGAAVVHDVLKRLNRDVANRGKAIHISGLHQQVGGLMADIEGLQETLDAD